MEQYTNQTALITGASAGIGAAFARALASRGANLVLVARSEAALQTLATELRQAYRIRVDVLPADLRSAGTITQLAADIAQRGLAIDMLVNNAGISTFGPFETIASEKQRDEITLNITALVELTNTFLPPMLVRRKGTIINLASIGSFVPMPYQAVYGATKAFVLRFCESLWAECRNRGVRILALCPGPVETNFFTAPGGERFASMAKARPEQVVAAGLRALERGDHVFVPGLSNWLLTQLPRLLPLKIVARIMDRALRPAPPTQQGQPG